MPADFVKKDFNNISRGKVFLEEHLRTLAVKYEVSKMAMEIRLEELKLI